MSCAVVVPWRAGCEHRDRAWQWLRSQWPWPVVEAPGRQPWSKGSALYPALLRCEAEIVVVADADVWCDATADAVAAVEAGEPWAIPHKGVHRLTEDATAQFITGADWARLPLDQRPYRGTEGGGIVVAPRAALLDIPLDPRFIGWGQEDESWGFALACLLGPAWRAKAPLVHLWHPPQDRLTRARGSEAGWRLRRRYWQARKDPGAMRRLLEEARRDLRTHHHAVHDHQAAAVGHA